MAKGNEELANTSEREKARGQTPSQRENRSYHEGDFQTTDPVTGEARGPLAPHARPELQGDAVGTERTSGEAARGDDAEAGDDGVNATDAARELARQEGVNLRSIRGSGADGRITVEDVRHAKSAS